MAAPVLLRARLLSLSLSLALLCSLHSASSVVVNNVTDWNSLVEQASRQYSANHQNVLRWYGLVHLAQYKALISNPKLDAPTLAAYTAHRVLSTIFPDLQSSLFDGLLARYDNAAPLAQVYKIRKAAQAVADKLLASRELDGYKDYSYFGGSGSGPGDYVFIGTQTYALYPQLGYVVPFAVTLKEVAKYELNSTYYPWTLGTNESIADINEVRDLGNQTNSSRTGEGSDLADFWRDGSGTSSLAGHINNITVQLLPDSFTNLQTALVLAQLNIAAYDASIVTWNLKYLRVFWRPQTAITKGVSVEVPPRLPIPSWRSYLSNPFHPEYPSGHSTTAGAFARVLYSVLNTDSINISVATFGTSQVGHILAPRSYQSLSDIVSDIGLSRIYGGVHFRKSVVDGAQIGNDVAEKVLARWKTVLLLKTATKIE